MSSRSWFLRLINCIIYQLVLTCSYNLVPSSSFLLILVLSFWLISYFWKSSLSLRWFYFMMWRNRASMFGCIGLISFLQAFSYKIWPFWRISYSWSSNLSLLGFIPLSFKVLIKFFECSILFPLILFDSFLLPFFEKELGLLMIAMRILLLNNDAYIWFYVSFSWIE